MSVGLTAWATTLFGIDPMMRKEFYGVSRRWQTYFHRAAYVAILGIVLWGVWRSFRSYGRMDYSSYTVLGRVLFTDFAWLQLGLIALSALSLSSDIIAKEVRAGTLGLLALTPLSPWRIVLGKWKSCLGYLLIILLSGVPILAIGVYLGGVAGDDLLRVAALTLSAAMLCAAFGILCSCTFRGSYACLISSTIGISMYCLLPALFSLLGEDRVWRDFVLEATCWVQPAYSMAAMMGGARAGGVIADYSWITASLVSAGLALVFVDIASLRVATLAKTEPRPPLIRRLFEGLDRAFERAPFGVRLWKERGMWDRCPLLWKEMHSRLTGKLRYSTRIGVVLLVVFTVLMMLVAEDLGRGTILAMLYSAVMAVLLLTAIGAGATSFAKEKEENKWDILLTTPVHAASFVGAKFAGALTGVAPLAVMMLLITASAHKVDIGNSWLLTPVVISTLTFCFLVVAAGLLFSLMVRSTRKAYAMTLGVVLSLLVAFPLLLSLGEAVDWWPRWFSQQVVPAILRATNPFFLLEGLEVSKAGEAEIWTGFYMGFTLYSLLGIACLIVACVRFNRFVGRPS